ncbi:hypothetical protein [Thermogutta sp.]|uniref:hypothetical protein n=1 Tax=Thermogutta sp. TaxID=1962930 RepID=UPI00321F79C1
MKQEQEQEQEQEQVLISGDEIEYSPDAGAADLAVVEDVAERVQYVERILDLLPPDGYYYRVTTQDGKQTTTYSKSSALQAVKNGGVLTRVLTKRGCQVLALATETSLSDTQIVSKLELMGDVFVQTSSSPGVTMTVIFGKDFQPIAAQCTVVVENKRVRAVGTGFAHAGERKFARPGDIVMLAETRALGRAITAAIGGGTISEEVEPEPPTIPDNLDAAGFIRLLSQHKIPLADALARLGVKSIADVRDFTDAARAIFGG